MWHIHKGPNGLAHSKLVQLLGLDQCVGVVLCTVGYEQLWLSQFIMLILMIYCLACLLFDIPILRLGYIHTWQLPNSLSCSFLDQLRWAYIIYILLMLILTMFRYLLHNKWRRSSWHCQLVRHQKSKITKWNEPRPSRLPHSESDEGSDGAGDDWQWDDGYGSA